METGFRRDGSDVTKGNGMGMELSPVCEANKSIGKTDEV
jgi:hypothetical protein